MPIRVPPPIASTAAEQWIIDSILHIDECLDEAKRQASDDLAEIKQDVKDIKADFDVTKIALLHSDGLIEGAVEAHKREHEAIDAQETGKRDLWKVQRTAFLEILSFGKTLIAILGAVGLWKILGG